MRVYFGDDNDILLHENITSIYNTDNGLSYLIGRHNVYKIEYYLTSDVGVLFTITFDKAMDYKKIVVGLEWWEVEIDYGNEGLPIE